MNAVMNCIVALSLIVGVTLVSLPAIAQNDSCLDSALINGINWPAVQDSYRGWTCGDDPDVIGFVLCTRRKSSCAPPAGPAETDCPACDRARATAGSPISLANGDTYIQQTDVRLPGLGGGLTLTRTWNSVWPFSQSAFANTGIFGLNWRSTYEERIFVGSDQYVKYSRADGNFWSFGGGGSGFLVAAPANAGATLVSGASCWTLTLKGGEKRLFDNNSGSLIAIIDRNGNTTQLSYDGANRLVTVTDPAARHLYFDYSGQSYLVASVTSDFGVSLSYSYDGHGRLVHVTNPDLSTLTFEYDANSFITAVKDSQGKILESHTYDPLGRGLTSSRANGVDAVTVIYPQ